MATLKLRGIEARRHDTPVFFSNYQQQILNMLSEAGTISEVTALFPKIESHFPIAPETTKRKEG